LNYNKITKTIKKYTIVVINYLKLYSKINIQPNPLINEYAGESGKTTKPEFAQWSTYPKLI